MGGGGTWAILITITLLLPAIQGATSTATSPVQVDEGGGGEGGGGEEEEEEGGGRSNRPW